MSEEYDEMNVIETEKNTNTINSESEEVAKTETSQESPKTPAINNDLTKKIDRRSITSKLNAHKARLAKLRKKREEEQRMLELFGSESDADESEQTETESESESEEEIIPKKYKKKRKTREQREIEELKNMLFKLAEKQKRQRKRRKKKKSPTSQQQQPIINYNIQPPKEETPPKKQIDPFMERLLRGKIINE